MYISKNTYFRPGLAEGSWNQSVHRVVYYRYLRFYGDGTVVCIDLFFLFLFSFTSLPPFLFFVMLFS